MMTPRIPGRRALVIALGVAGATVVGIAIAIWSQTGTGSGQGKALDAQPSVVTAGTVAADLYPGFNGGDLYMRVTNPNPYPVRFTSMTPGTVTSSDQSACPASNVTVTNKTGLTIDVPANTTTAVERKIDDVITLVLAAPDGCQGKTFTVGVTLNGVQQ